jgi:transcription antitermination factor NusG
MSEPKFAVGEYVTIAAGNAKGSQGLIVDVDQNVEVWYGVVIDSGGPRFDYAEHELQAFNP